MAFLQLSGIEKRFGDVRTIKGIDLAIDRGQFTVFVGPSGCGKSTLLRLIAGLETMDGGTLTLDGHGFAGALARSDDGATLECVLPPNGAFFGRIRSNPQPARSQP